MTESDKSIFDGLVITEDSALCRQYMGKYPVISVSLKGMDALNYEAAFQMAVQTMKRVFAKAQYLLSGVDRTG